MGLVHFSSLIPKMLTFTLAISCLTTSNLLWSMDLTFQVPMQYCSLQHWTLLPSCHIYIWVLFRFDSISSFSLELFLCSSAVAYWAPTDLGSSSFSVISFCLFMLSGEWFNFLGSVAPQQRFEMVDQCCSLFKAQSFIWQTKNHTPSRHEGRSPPRRGLSLIWLPLLKVFSFPLTCSVQIRTCQEGNVFVSPTFLIPSMDFLLFRFHMLSPVSFSHCCFGLLFPILTTYYYCSRGSQGKNTEVVCYSLLQWTMFCQNSPPWPIRLGWPYTAWLIVSLS